MDPTPSTKLSRRDAIKLLGAAAGASVLANLPSKWSTPQLTAGVLPAHAQTSGPLRTLACAPLTVPEFPEVSSVVTVAPLETGIDLHFEIELTNLTTVHALSGFTSTDAFGMAAVSFGVVFLAGLPNTAKVTWSFEHPADGTDTCSQSIILAS